jgi:hypothetical protein
MEKHFMIDIETTGVDQETDDILQVALVEIEYKYPYWHLTGRSYQSLIHSKRQPESDFAKKHMADLYKACNEAPEELNLNFVSEEIYRFIHLGDKTMSPKFFMGWNASNFDMPFMFKRGLLTPSFYKRVDGKEVLMGDAHYRIYEQTGALNIIQNITGLKNDTIKKLAEDLNPTKIVLPKGKSHDALYDCYWQIIMMNGLIEIGRKGILR